MNPMCSRKSLFWTFWKIKGKRRERRKSSWYPHPDNYYRQDLISIWVTCLFDYYGYCIIPVGCRCKSNMEDLHIIKTCWDRHIMAVPSKWLLSIYMLKCLKYISRNVIIQIGDILTLSSLWTVCIVLLILRLTMVKRDQCQCFSTHDIDLICKE